MAKPENEREAIARIIDPDAWSAFDRHGKRTPATDVENYCKRSLIKADQILALRRDAGEPVPCPAHGFAPDACCPGCGFPAEAHARIEIDDEIVNRIATATMVCVTPHLKHMISFNTLCEAVSDALYGSTPKPARVEE